MAFTFVKCIYESRADSPKTSPALSRNSTQFNALQRRLTRTGYPAGDGKTPRFVTQRALVVYKRSIHCDSTLST